MGCTGGLISGVDYAPGAGWGSFMGCRRGLISGIDYAPGIGWGSSMGCRRRLISGIDYSPGAGRGLEWVRGRGELQDLTVWQSSKISETWFINVARQQQSMLAPSAGSDIGCGTAWPDAWNESRLEQQAVRRSSSDCVVFNSDGTS